MLTWTPDVCLYHFPCDDGFAAAWVVRKRWPDVALFPVNYGLPLPDFDFANKNVLIVDFSLKAPALHELAGKARTVVILDHHKTAEADLQGFRKVRGHDHRTIARLFIGMGPESAPGNVATIFDMERSGAALTWRFCFDGRTPALISYVEDRDLWRFKMPDSRAVSLYLRSWPYDFDRWSIIAGTLDMATPTRPILGQDRQGLMDEARAIERFYDAKIAEIVPTATLRSIGPFDGVPVAHAPYAFVSDVGHALLKAHPEAPFAAVIVDAHGARTFSLRSEPSRQDVSEVARLFGGGGHRDAAGFRVPVV